MLLTVNDIAKKTITKDKITFCSLNNKEKNAKSGTKLFSYDTATKPVKPIIKTKGITIKKAIIKLFF